MEILSPRPVIEIAEGLAGRMERANGNKILWLHGYTLDSSSWGEMWNLLSGWHHIGVDLPGHGASAPIVEGSNLRILGGRLAELCKRQDIRHIVALSFGTMIALQIALELPDFFASMTLGAPAIAGGPQDTEMSKVYSRLIMLYRQQGLTETIRDIWMNSPAWRGIEKQEGLKEALISLVARHRWDELQSYGKIQQFTYPPQNFDDFARIRFPVLLLVGDREMPAFKECARILQEKIPACDYHELPDTDHLCMLQSPQLSAQLIAVHLRKYAV